MTSAEVITAAAETVRTAWTKKRTWRPCDGVKCEESGCDGEAHDCRVDDPRARGWCLNGALAKAAGVNHRLYFRTLKLLDEVLGVTWSNVPTELPPLTLETRIRYRLAGSALAAWAEEPLRTVRDVITLLHRARVKAACMPEPQ